MNILLAMPRSTKFFRSISAILPNKKRFHMSQLRPQAPKNVTVLLSVALVALGLLGAFISPAIADNGDWFLLAGFVLLLLGVYVKGL